MTNQTKFIWTTKVGEKGQIVIPKEAREIFNLNKGDALLLFGDIERGLAIGKKEDYLEFADKAFGVVKGDKNA